MNGTIIRRFVLFFVLFFVFVLLGTAEYVSPEGYWKTIDDKTGEVKSIVKLWAEDGKLKGQVLRIFPKEGEDPDPVCDKCKGHLKNVKTLGMIFMWDFYRKGDKWIEGEIVDPENGKQYHCQLYTVEEGKKLKVFGYIKIIFKIGRTQTWLKSDESELKL